MTNGILYLLDCLLEVGIWRELMIFLLSSCFVYFIFLFLCGGGAKRPSRIAGGVLPLVGKRWLMSMVCI